MGPTGRSRILQVHPTRRCNLRCLHCYSSSSPEARDEIPLALLQDAVSDAADCGYNVVSVSGGEPLLYRPLRPLLESAKASGMGTTVTTNGMLLDGRRLDRLDGVIDLLAISLDGEPTSHNRMRASERAFETMIGRLEALRERDIPFGFVFTLTQYNLHELEWVADFAIEQGARLLQIHPLEAVGRADLDLEGACPDGVESSFAFLEVMRLREQLGDRLVLQLDISHRPSLERGPHRVYADAREQRSSALADLVSPLIIEPDATVVPLMYGFGRRFALGNLELQSLAAMAESWRRETLPRFRALCREVLAEPRALVGQNPFFNWYEAMRSASQRSAPTKQAGAA